VMSAEHREAEQSWTGKRGSLRLGGHLLEQSLRIGQSVCVFIRWRCGLSCGRVVDLGRISVDSGEKVETAEAAPPPTTAGP
jgi:hypothetical protein